jgi:hypothetical protein
MVKPLFDDVFLENNAIIIRAYHALVIVFMLFSEIVSTPFRRVMLNIFSSIDEKPKAVIAYGWEKKRFYVKWFRNTDPIVIKDLMGPVLNRMSPQSDIAPELLTLFKKVLLKDKKYMDRVKRHYSIMREKIDKPKPKTNWIY